VHEGYGRARSSQWRRATTSDVAVMPELTFIKVGTFDDTSRLRPTMQIFCDSAKSWGQLGGELQSFPKMPG
jgi:hypothetical protein